MKYYCDLCDYSTIDSGNWVHHKRSKKHIRNEKDDEEIKNMANVISHINFATLANANMNINYQSNKLACRYCDKQFTCKSSLSRHKNHRCEKRMFHNDLIDNLKEQVEKIKDKIKDEEIEELKKNNEYLKSLVEKSTNITNNVISIVSDIAKTL